MEHSFHQDTVGDIYRTSWDPIRGLRFTTLEREGERKESVSAAGGLVFTSTAGGRGGKTGGEQACGDLKIK